MKTKTEPNDWWYLTKLGGVINHQPPIDTLTRETENNNEVILHTEWKAILIQATQ